MGRGPTARRGQPRQITAAQWKARSARDTIGLALVVVLAGPRTPAVAAAQDSAGPVALNAAPSTASLAGTIARHLDALAAESLRARAEASPTPSLEARARYVAAGLARLGLRPGVRHRVDTLIVERWVQRYRTPGQRRLDPARSYVECTVVVGRRGKTVYTESGGTPEKQTRLRFDTTAYFSGDAPPPRVPEIAVRSMFDADRAGSARVVVVSGPHTAASLPDSILRGSVVWYIPAAGLDSATRRQLLARFYAVSEGVVAVSTDTPASFGARRRAARSSPVPLADNYLQASTLKPQWSWVVEAEPDAAREWLGAAGIDLDSARYASVPRVQQLPSAQVWLNPNMPPGDSEPGDSSLVTAPNVAAVLEGSDSVLRREYVVVSAPLDARRRPAGNDAMASDDAGSGIAGLLALADAFRQSGMRPRRSLVFLATSGGPEAAWGGYFFASVYGRQINLSPLDEMRGGVANVTLDRIARPADSGTVAVAGAEHLELVRMPAWVAAAHGELNLAVTSGTLAPLAPEPGSGDRTGTDALSASDHIAFVQNGVPSLYLSGGASATPAPPDSVPVNTSYAARVVGLAFYLIQDLANGRRVQWNDAGRHALWQQRTP